MTQDGIELDAVAPQRDEIVAGGRTAVLVGVDGRGVAVIGIADTPRATAGSAVAALAESGVEVVMLTGDNEATARNIADQLGIRSDA